MTSFTFEPTAATSTYQFPSDGTPPASVLATRAFIGWEIGISDISAIPAKMASARAPDGTLVRDVRGFVSMSIGAATSDGQELYGEGQPRWGYVKRRQRTNDVGVVLHVSEAIFRRVVELASRGVLPSVEVEVVEAGGLRTSIADGRLEAWDWLKAPNLEIAWFKLQYKFAGAPTSNTSLERTRER